MQKNHEILYLKRFGLFFLSAFFICFLISNLYRAVLFPVGFGFFLTYLLMPLVEKLEQIRLPRMTVALCAMSVAVFSMSLILTRLLPVIYLELSQIIILAPSAYHTVIEQWIPSLRNFVIELGFMDAAGFDEWFATSGVPGRMTAQLEGAAATVWRGAPKILTLVMHIILTPVVVFFMLLHYERILTFFRMAVPVDLKPGVSRVMDVVHRTLQDVIGSHMTIASIVAAMYVVGFSVIGFSSPVAIGLMAGACRVVPYLDIFVGGALCLLVILSDFSGWWQLIEVVIVFAVVQSIDGMLVTPRVVGGRFGLHPLVVIVSVLSFGSVFGFWGVLMTIPTVAICVALVREFWPLYKTSSLYRGIGENR
ncbi:MAG: AI-2E family transporter [Oligoflexales bacterium]